MKAVIYNKYGPPEVLQMVERKKPEPGEDELLIKVKATSVSSGVIWMRNGIHPDSKLLTLIIRIVNGFKKPKKEILGYEFSGKVEATGKNVRLFKKGDKVYGTCTGLKNGAYAEYLCVPEKWKQGIVALMPTLSSYNEAAVIPAGGITALQILRKGNIKKGQQVLIYGASGSVGSYATQLAKYFGAIVTGVASSTKRDMIKEIGADYFIDYKKEDFLKNPTNYDVIFDAVGKLSKSRAKALLKKSGTYLSVKVLTNEKTEYLNKLSKLFDKGHIVPFIDRVYPLDQIVEAHRYTEKGYKKGNVVITIT